MKVTARAITVGQLRALEALANRLAAETRMAMLGDAVTPTLRSEIHSARETCAAFWNRFHGES